MPVDCITFDLDDTLWDCRPVIAAAEDACFAWIERNCPRIAAAQDRESLLADRQQHYRANPQQAHDLTFMRKQWLAAIGSRYGYGEEIVEPAFRAFWERRNRVELFPGVREMLGDLRPRYRIGAITNGNADVDHIGIGELFDFVVTAAGAGAAKPDAAIFDAAIAAAGTVPGRAVHVGDDPHGDVLGAAAAGLRAIWVNPRLAPWPGGRAPDAVATDVTEVPALVSRWG